ncbi:galactocerebrosidase [Patella vulgata]|uniref:galactocerebrosidase n=1 Tax=Patella vulgata TaxID=6465 RepID=UPI0024A7D293|nr:galactocerebrosidase [Patella vulgata]
MPAVYYSLWLCLVLCPYVITQYIYPIDDTPGFGRRFDGVGGLSGGGATSKLLVNYPQQQRDEILDYLFKPNFGASLHILKVEIGGDGQSTDGTEASHMHYSWDLNFERGYEWWMMKEAKKRNPDIKLFGLPWAFPGWVGGGTLSPYTYPEVTSTYVCEWILGAKRIHNLTIDYVGIWNERDYNVTYILTLRKTLDSFGLQHVEIEAADGGIDKIAHDVLTNPDLALAVSIIGYHQPRTDSDMTGLQTGKPLWASEDYSQPPDNYGGSCWARTINQDYSNGFITAQVAWCIINSMYDGLPFNDNGLMRAIEPWSGSYYVAPPIWASAHTTQFTKPGWMYLKHGSGVGNFSRGGSYVTFMSPDQQDFTVVIETGTFNHSHCRKVIEPFTVEPQDVILQLKGTLAKVDQLQVWYTKLTFDGSSSTIFQKKSPLKVINGEIRLSLDIDEVWTLTTITTGQKGQHNPPPPPAPFPLPYTDDFEVYPIYSEAYNLVAQAGYYEITDIGAPQNKVIRQMSLEMPVFWGKTDSLGVTLALIGNANWTDINISVDARPAPVNGTDGVFVACRLYNLGLRDSINAGLYFFIFPANKTFVVSRDVVRKHVILRGHHAGITAEWNQLSLSVKGSEAVGSINSVQVFNTKISGGIIQGFVGLGTTSYKLADFDNLYISRP